MASFGSTKCARNSVASRKACVEGVKNGTFFGKNAKFSASFSRDFEGIFTRRMPHFARKINEPFSIIFLGSRSRKRPSRGKFLCEF